MKIILIVLLSSFIFVSGYAQEVKEAHYVTVFIQHRLKKTGVKEEVMISIGNSDSHPLKGNVINIENTYVRVKKGEKFENIMSEAEMLKYLTDLGWSIVDTRMVKIVSSEYQKYLFKK